MPEPTDQELQDQEDAVRAEMAEKIFGKQEIQSPEDEPGPEKKQPVDEKKEPPDPWAGVSPALREQFESMSSRLKDFDSVTNRLKQAESRIGSITNQLHQAKQAAVDAAKKNENAPTAEEIEAAAKSKRLWDDLKAENPEWANAVDERLKAEKAATEKALAASKAMAEKVNELESRLADPKTDQSEEKLQFIREELKVMTKFPGIDLDELRESKDFQGWVAKADPDIARRCSSNSAKDAIYVIEKYQEATKPQKTVAEIAEERAKRLAAAQLPNKDSVKKVKSEEDMTDDEYRKIAARKIFGGH